MIPIFPTALDVVFFPWRVLLEFLPAILLVGALNVALILVTVFLIYRFFGKKKK